MQTSFAANKPTVKKPFDVFDRVFVLNLRYCKDRKEQVRDRLSSLVSDSNLEFVEAVSGELASAPAWWTSGNGAWGCMRSHTNLMERVLNEDKLKNFLLLEDDVIFSSDVAKRFPAAWSQLPKDWGQFYLGGQHLREATPCGVRAPKLVVGNNLNRTHAIAYNKRYLGQIYRHCTHAPDYINNPCYHIDHILGIAHERRDWPVYAPNWWFAGQGANRSNISGRNLGDLWWNNDMYASSLPFVRIPESKKLLARDAKLLHFGNNLIPGGYKDLGYYDAKSFNDVLSLLSLLRREAFHKGKIPGICFDSVELADLQGALGKNKVIELKDANLQHLVNYPENGLFRI